MNIDSANIGVLIGFTIFVFAVGVLFSVTGSAQQFADVVSVSVKDAAVGWMVLGGVAMIVGIIND